jgi:hypothetical protein
MDPEADNLKKEIKTGSLMLLLLNSLHQDLQHTV